MTPEAWTVIGTGIVILIAIAASSRQQRRDMNELRLDLGGKIEAVRKELHGEIETARHELRGELSGEIGMVRGDIFGLRERMARLEGLVDGLREALIGAESARDFHGANRDAG